MKHFWKTYIAYYGTHKRAMWVNIIYFIVFAIFTALWLKKFPFLFCLGYVMGDPVSYYVYRYRRILKDELAAHGIGCHEPLLELNGKIIEGTKRCKNCGLNENYWLRFPRCCALQQSEKPVVTYNNLKVLDNN
jgi:hypothetical protein